ncbi:hypothetical protein DVA86_33710 [Streptomyces armeniacus]|uniref:Uncharacterized protein n=1 Tax=Streptomyces armeniacus TaxID=83291 RepID=A0A345XYR1_9ACTN|nr:hypothetical protein DVA86_33710 [Streptomyces armeniacus]
MTALATSRDREPTTVTWWSSAVAAPSLYPGRVRAGGLFGTAVRYGMSGRPALPWRPRWGAGGVRL